MNLYSLEEITHVKLISNANLREIRFICDGRSLFLIIRRREIDTDVYYKEMIA